MHLWISDDHRQPHPLGAYVEKRLTGHLFNGILTFRASDTLSFPIRKYLLCGNLFVYSFTRIRKLDEGAAGVAARVTGGTCGEPHFEGRVIMDEIGHGHAKTGHFFFVAIYMYTRIYILPS